MVYLIEYCEAVTAHRKLDSLLVVISLVQEYGTALGSSVIVVNGEVNMSKVELVSSLIVSYKRSIYGKFDDSFNGIAWR